MSITFPLIRLVRDPELGFAPETVTRKEFEILQYQYAAAELAGFWYESKLGFLNIKLPDLWHDWYGMTAILPSDAAADFSYAIKEFNAERKADVREKVQTGCGYSWGPIGATEGFGYNAPVDAWLITHPGGSVFFYREQDDVEKDFHKWAGYWITQQVPLEWPKASESLATLLVPTEMVNAQQAARKRNIARARNLRSSLFR